MGFFGKMALTFNLKNAFQSWGFKTLNLQISVSSKIMPLKFQIYYCFLLPESFHCTTSGLGVMPMCFCHIMGCSHQSIHHMRLQSIDLSLSQSMSYMRKGTIFVLYSKCLTQCLGIKEQYFNRLIKNGLYHLCSIRVNIYRFN